MGDVALALNEAAQVKVQPTKIQLQKFVYLTDVLGQVVGSLKPKEAHKTYRNGPYDAAIQNAVDALAFRGLVTVAGVWRTPSGHLATSYKLAAPGGEFVQRISQHQAFAKKTRMASLVGAELRVHGWNRIVSLVYAEPTFVATRPTGWGSRLAAEDGLQVSTAFVVAVLRRAAGTLDPERPASAEWITGRFFAYLDDYARRYGNVTQVAG
jgi:hypothetical protein